MTDCDTYTKLWLELKTTCDLSSDLKHKFLENFREMEIYDIF